MVLSVRHRPRLKPAVKHFRNSLKNLPVVCESYIIDKMSMKIGDLFSTFFLEIFLARNHLNLAIVTSPQRNGRSPVPITRNRPVACVFKPFSKPTFFDMLRNPVDLLIRL